MATQIHHLSDVDPRAELGNNVIIGPFCTVGPHVTIGDETELISHVAMVAHTTIGKRNRFFQNAVVGGEPQDVSFQGSGTKLVIGNDNLFREGVTINIGAEKEDHTTRIGNNNLFMGNSHIAHNCHIHNNVILVNGAALGGHVHMHDGAIISANTVVHHFSTIGTLAFISGGCRVPHDVLPYMLAAGSDNPTVKTINIVGMRRAGISEEAIKTVKKIHKLLYRKHIKAKEIRNIITEQNSGALPQEVITLLDAAENQMKGKFGRAREAVRNIQIAPTPEENKHSSRKAA
ncbi:Acyl-[acyl-carrier-protein]--UDP-N-acetylglucosamine O-acyltransferase [hydrothermal vent metagenome]|uniref:Acyl-[acyl-carrier-protein]--UDP-N-acetylglucosamine O-acyltransferase n=1 Tax=hydrothermal vent metagenome TaxID=652676 RepID=A0A3B1DII5_9ZZZZ